MTLNSSSSQLACALRTAATRLADTVGNGCALVFAALPADLAPDAGTRLRAAAGFAAADLARAAAAAALPIVRETIKTGQRRQCEPLQELGKRGAAGTLVLPLRWNDRMRGVLVIDFVPPDHYATYPKSCMGGWGSVGLNITPDGHVLPCHAAASIKSLAFDRVQDRPLQEIWENGSAFNAFRGDGWMQEPCRTCERKTLDWGGCRCQAMAILGDPAATDPTCSKSPHNAALRVSAEADAGSDVALIHRAAPA